MQWLIQHCFSAKVHFDDPVGDTHCRAVFRLRGWIKGSKRREGDMERTETGREDGEAAVLEQGTRKAAMMMMTVLVLDDSPRRRTIPKNCICWLWPWS